MAATYNFPVDQHATFSTTITLKNDAGEVRDLSNYIAKMQARYRHKAGSLLFTLVEGDGITINPSTNVITITINADRTGMLRDDTFYDIIIIDDNDNVERILEGQLIVNEGVTK